MTLRGRDMGMDHIRGHGNRIFGKSMLLHPCSLICPSPFYHHLWVPVPMDLLSLDPAEIGWQVFTYSPPSSSLCHAYIHAHTHNHSQEVSEQLVLLVHTPSTPPPPKTVLNLYNLIFFSGCPSLIQGWTQRNYLQRAVWHLLGGLWSEDLDFGFLASGW